MCGPCRHGRHSSTCTATTSVRGVAGHRSPPWSGCSRRWASPPPAVRTAVSRMVRQGWLRPAPAGLRTGISAHPEGRPPARRGGRPDLPHRPARPGTAGSTSWCWTPPGSRRDRPAARRQPELPRLRHARRARPGSPPAPGRGGRPAARRGRRRATSGSPPRTPPAPPARWRVVRRAWDLTEIGQRLRALRRRPAPAARRGHRAQHRRGGVRGPVPAGARLAYVPVPGPAAAPGAAARSGGRAPPRPASSTGTRPGCGRPPTGTSTSASTLATASSDRRVVRHVTEPLLVDRDRRRRHPDAQPARRAERARRRAQGGAAGHAGRAGGRPVLPGGRAGRGRPGVLRRPGPAGARRDAWSPAHATRWTPCGRTTTRSPRGWPTLPKPVVAAVRGHGRRGRRVAGASSPTSGSAGRGPAFLMAFANVGLAADTGASWTLPRLVGHAKAIELLMLAEPVGADEALPARPAHPAGRRRRAGAAGRPGAGRPAGRRADRRVRRDQAAAARSATPARSPTRWPPRRRPRRSAAPPPTTSAATAAFVAKQKPVFDGGNLSASLDRLRTADRFRSWPYRTRPSSRLWSASWPTGKRSHTCCAGPPSARPPAEVDAAERAGLDADAGRPARRRPAPTPARRPPRSRSSAPTRTPG